MSVKDKLIAVLAGLATVCGVIHVPAVVAETSPSFDSPECSMWDRLDFQYEDNKITGFSQQGQVKAQDYHELCLPDTPESGSPDIAIIDRNAFKNKGLTSIKRWPAQLHDIYEGAFLDNKLTTFSMLPDGVNLINGQAFRRNALTKLPDWPKNLETIGTFAFTDNELTEVPQPWPPKLKRIGARAFNNNNIVQIPRSWPPTLQTIGNVAFGDNDITCLAYVKWINDFDTSASRYFDKKVLSNKDCGSSFSKVTVARDSESAVAKFDPGERFENRDTIESCVLSAAEVKGVTILPVGEKNCDFEIVADKTAELGSYDLDVLIQPSFGSPYSEPLKFTVSKQHQPEGSSVGDLSGWLIGGFGMLILGWVIGVFVTVPGEGRDLVLKRQLHGAGMRGCFPDCVSAWMWKFHKATGTPMAEGGDTDNDGLTDEEERDGRRNTAFGLRPTNPFIADTDGDGTNDGEEIIRGTDPTVKN